MDQYESMIAQIGQTISHSEERINGLTNNVNRAISLMMASRPKGLTPLERDVLLSFEALCVESLWRTAWLFHERDEHDSARHCLEVGRRLQDAVDLATTS
jgi:hypothetical protein